MSEDTADGDTADSTADDVMAKLAEVVQSGAVALGWWLAELGAAVRNTALADGDPAHRCGIAIDYAAEFGDREPSSYTRITCVTCAVVWEPRYSGRAFLGWVPVKLPPDLDPKPSVEAVNAELRRRRDGEPQS